MITAAGKLGVDLKVVALADVFPEKAESTMTAIPGREATYTGRNLKWGDMMTSDLDLMPKNMTMEAGVENPARPVPTPGKPKWKRT